MVALLITSPTAAMPRNRRYWPVIFVLERPDAVENVVRSRGAEEPQRIGHIFVQLQPLLAEIGDAEIDEDARAADDAEFEKLFYHKFPTSVGTDFPLNQFV